MANPNPPLENLKPFKPGQSGNPKGKPKGRRSLSTVVRDILEKEIDWKLIPLKDSTEFQKRFGGKTAAEAITYSALAKSMAGDSAARDWLRRSGYGDKVDITSGDKPIPLLGVLNVPANDSLAEDTGDGEADQGSAGGNVSGEDDRNPDAADSDSPDQE